MINIHFLTWGLLCGIALYILSFTLFIFNWTVLVLVFEVSSTVIISTALPAVLILHSITSFFSGFAGIVLYMKVDSSISKTKPLVILTTYFFIDFILNYLPFQKRISGPNDLYVFWDIVIFIASGVLLGFFLIVKKKQTNNIKVDQIN